jgi:leucine dehydrogenase
MSTAIRKGNGRPARAVQLDKRDRVASVPERVPPVPFDHEELVIRRGVRSGRYVVVAVHSTALGPALGGVRLWDYPATIDAARDALRLAQGMTMKAAAAGLDLGGGKGVICAPHTDAEDTELRRAMLLDFGDLVESLDGRYITAEDVGMSPDDMVTIAERTDHLTGLPSGHGGSGDPSPFTAAGVEAAMRACASSRLGSSDLAGRRAVVVGLGHVGEALARRLVSAGAEVAGADVVPAKRAVAKSLGIEWMEPSEAMLAECDLLAPCALGGAVNEANVERLRCRVLCGSANNQLASEDLAERLAERRILYAPDYIANSGGLIHVYMEIRGYDEAEATELVLGIERTMERIVAAAEAREITPLRAAGEIARERLEAAGAEREPVRH